MYTGNYSSANRSNNNSSQQEWHQKEESFGTNRDRYMMRPNLVERNENSYGTSSNRDVPSFDRSPGAQVRKDSQSKPETKDDMRQFFYPFNTLTNDLNFIQEKAADDTYHLFNESGISSFEASGWNRSKQNEDYSRVEPFSKQNDTVVQHSETSIGRGVSRAQDMGTVLNQILYYNTNFQTNQELTKSLPSNIQHPTLHTASSLFLPSNERVQLKHTEDVFVRNRNTPSNDAVQEINANITASGVNFVPNAFMPNFENGNRPPNVCSQYLQRLLIREREILAAHRSISSGNLDFTQRNVDEFYKPDTRSIFRPSTVHMYNSNAEPDTWLKHTTTERKIHNEMSLFSESESDVQDESHSEKNFSRNFNKRNTEYGKIKGTNSIASTESLKYNNRTGRDNNWRIPQRSVQHVKEPKKLNKDKEFNMKPEYESKNLETSDSDNLLFKSNVRRQPNKKYNRKQTRSRIIQGNNKSKEGNEHESNEGNKFLEALSRINITSAENKSTEGNLSEEEYSEPVDVKKNPSRGFELASGGVNFNTTGSARGDNTNKGVKDASLQPARRRFTSSNYSNKRALYRDTSH